MDSDDRRMEEIARNLLLNGEPDATDLIIVIRTINVVPNVAKTQVGIACRYEYDKEIFEKVLDYAKESLNDGNSLLAQ